MINRYTMVCLGMFRSTLMRISLRFMCIDVVVICLKIFFRENLKLMSFINEFLLFTLKANEWLISIS